MIRRVRWTGDVHFARDMRRRVAPEQVQRAVIAPWKRDVQGFYLAMFRAGGSVPGEARRGKWAKNSEWTKAAKGHGKPMLSGRMYQFGTMVRSLVITVRRKGRHFTFDMSNRARGKDGFDYPSYLHAPGRRRRYTVEPTEATALRLVAPSGQVIFRAKTRPIKPKARPHIFWQERMIEAWGRRMANWVLRGVVSSRKIA